MHVVNSQWCLMSKKICLSVASELNGGVNSIDQDADD